MNRLLLIIFCLTSPTWAASYYILASGPGTCTIGVTNTWTTACNKIPDPLAAGDTVVIGNDGTHPLSDTEYPHKFTGSGTSVSHITVRFASAALDSGVAGWSAAYATFNNSIRLWQTSHTVMEGIIAGKTSFWTFCGSYYDIDGGLIGTPHQPGSYGFAMRSQQRFSIAMLAIAPTSGNCSGSPNLSTISIKNMEFDGISAVGNAIGALGTIAVSADGLSGTWVSGDQFNTAWNGKMSQTVGINRSACTLATNGIASSTTLTFASACAAKNGTFPFSFGAVGNQAIAFGVNVGSNTVDQVSITDNYIHDVGPMVISLGNATNHTFARNFLQRNISDIASHANGWEVQTVTGRAGVTGCSIYDNTFEDMQGTGVIIVLNGINSNCNVYNNVSYYTAAFSTPTVFTNGTYVRTFPFCSYGDYAAACGTTKFIGDNNPTGFWMNSQFYGNSASNMISASSTDYPKFGTTNCGLVISITNVNGTSSGNDEQNNLFYNCDSAYLITAAFGTHSNNSAYATSFNGDTAAASDKTIAVTNPFNGASDLSLRIQTDAGGNALGAPYNLDYIGTVRGTACNGGWCRGAFEYAPPVSPSVVTLYCAGNGASTASGLTTGDGNIDATCNNAVATCVHGAQNTAAGCKANYANNVAIATISATAAGGTTLSSLVSSVGGCSGSACSINTGAGNVDITAFLFSSPTISLTSNLANCNPVNGCSPTLTATASNCNTTGCVWECQDVTGSLITDTVTGVPAFCAYGSTVNALCGDGTHPSGTFSIHWTISGFSFNPYQSAQCTVFIPPNVGSQSAVSTIGFGAYIAPGKSWLQF